MADSRAAGIRALDVDGAFAVGMARDPDGSVLAFPHRRPRPDHGGAGVLPIENSAKYRHPFEGRGSFCFGSVSASSSNVPRVSSGSARSCRDGARKCLRKNDSSAQPRTS